MEQSLVKKEHYYQESMKTLASAKEWAKFFLDSEMCPRHFYKTKIEDGRKVPDYTKGNVGALLMVLQHGDDVDMKPSQAIQQIIPINGLMSIKGDGGKALILRSRQIKPGTWKETVEGTIQAKTYKVTITATRADTGEILSRSFSVDDAMRAGLWITDAMIQAKDGWMRRLSPWFRYPERMIKYRALGFLERDLFPDVLSGMITSEEAQDYPPDAEVVTITTVDGKKVQVTPQLGDRSAEVTDDTVKKIDKLKVEPEKKLELGDEKPLDDSVKDALYKRYKTKVEDFLNMGSKIYSFAETLIYEENKLSFWIDHIPGKKSNKKYRLAIMAFQDGNFDKYLVQEIPEIKKLKKTIEKSMKPSTEKTQEQDIDKTLAQVPGQVKKDAEGKSKKESPETTEFDKQFDDGKDKKSKQVEANSTNKQGIEIPDLPVKATAEGKRERPFDEVKFIYEELTKVGVDNNAWLARTKGHPFGQLYQSKEGFCRSAKKNEINELLNSL